MDNYAYCPSKIRVFCFEAAPLKLADLEDGKHNRWYPHPNVRISRERGVSLQSDYLQGRDLAFFVAKKRRHMGDDHGVFL